jgi:hypothetical protein
VSRDRSQRELDRIELGITWEGVLKVQMPIASNVKNPGCLTYSEDDVIRAQLPITKDVKRVMKGELKKYFNAYRTKDGFIHLDEERRGQDW